MPQFHPSPTHSNWQDDVHFNRFYESDAPRDFDVIVIGAGVTGLTAALRLKEAGKTVAVLELDQLGRGETSLSTAHLTERLDISYVDLIANFGLASAKLAVAASHEALASIEATAHKLDASACGFIRVQGYQYAESAEGYAALEREAEAAKSLGVPSELIDSTPLPYPVRGALRFTRQAQIHPLRYVAALAEKVRGHGSYIFDETRVTDLHESDRCLARTSRGNFYADHAIVAAHVPVLHRFSMHPKLAAYRTYAMALRLEDDQLPQGLFWDDHRPYRYIRSAGEFLIIGGEDHKTGQQDDAPLCFQRLEDWARERFDVTSVAARWSGQIIESVDGLPFIGLGPLSERSYIATGYAGNGMTWGTVAGQLIADLTLGIESQLADLLDARRFKPLASARKFITENKDYPSRMVTDRLATIRSNDSLTLRENHGAVVRIEANGVAQTVAAYRDPNGEVHLLSPVCPHLGCYVGWNDAEKSWDCPCHGSRFDPLGKLLNGPATADLSKTECKDGLGDVTQRIEANEGLASSLAGSVLNAFSYPLK